MGLHGVPRASRTTDRATEKHVVAEEEIRRQVLAHRSGVRLDPGVELVARAVLQELHAIPLVVVEHEDGKEPSDIGSYDRSAAEVVALRVRLLAEHA